MSSDERTSKMVAITEDTDYYRQAYAAYAGFADRKLALYERWADDVFVPQAAEKLRASFPDLEELNVLGVGSGSGEVDICLLERLAPKFPRINNDVIEPSVEMISKFKHHLQTKKPALSGVKFNFHQTSIQEFRRDIRRSEAEGGKRKRFHFIHVVHSIYYATDLRAAILDLFESLEYEGLMLIITSTDAHLMNRIKVRFPFMESSRRIPMKQSSSSDIKQHLHQLSVPFTSHVQKWHTDITSCFDPDSKTGNMILDFLTHTVHFRATAPDELQLEVISFLRTMCVPEEGRCRGVETSDQNRIGTKYTATRDWECTFCVREKELCD